MLVEEEAMEQRLAAMGVERLQGFVLVQQQVTTVPQEQPQVQLLAVAEPK